MKKKQYKCKCCNYYTLDDYPFDICPICCWENSGIDALEVSLWTEDILGNKFIADKIEDYHPIDKNIELILEKMTFLGDEEGEKDVKVNEEDQQLIRDILKNKIKFYSDSLKKEIPSYKYRIQKSD